MSDSLVAILGGAGGVLVLLGGVIAFVWICMSPCKFNKKNSETGSSDPSAIVELRSGGDPGSSTGPPLSGPQVAKQFTMEVLEQATKHFNDSNIIGSGSFGLVFKGLLLLDGTVVAIKRRFGTPRAEFIEEVTNMSGIWHRNLVTLLGYCQESGYQMLVYEYVSNGSMCHHLYETRKDSTTRLEFKQRVSIALGAAKGLCYLHSRQPHLIHGNFKTANVMVDENFIAKVADAGVLKLLEKIEDAGPSHSTPVNVFKDPEVDEMGMVSDTSDVYSYGVFLLELITGREASQIVSNGSSGSIIQWVEANLSSNDFVDQRLVGTFTANGLRDFVRIALLCMSFPGYGRPKMQMVASELDRILEKEIVPTTVMGEGTATFALGSQLFTQ